LGGLLISRSSAHGDDNRPSAEAVVSYQAIKAALAPLLRDVPIMPLTLRRVAEQTGSLSADMGRLGSEWAADMGSTQAGLASLTAAGHGGGDALALCRLAVALYGEAARTIEGLPVVAARGADVARAAARRGSRLIVLGDRLFDETRAAVSADRPVGYVTYMYPDAVPDFTGPGAADGTPTSAPAEEKRTTGALVAAATGYFERRPQLLVGAERTDLNDGVEVLRRLAVALGEAAKNTPDHGGGRLLGLSLLIEGEALAGVSETDTRESVTQAERVRKIGDDLRRMAEEGLRTNAGSAEERRVR